VVDGLPDVVHRQGLADVSFKQSQDDPVHHRSPFLLGPHLDDGPSDGLERLSRCLARAKHERGETEEDQPHQKTCRTRTSRA
jgi:hypothetical protein